MRDSPELDACESCLFIHAGKVDHPIVRLWRVLHVARPSSYHYAWRDGEAARRARQTAEDALAHEITVLHVASRRTYGVPRTHAELRRSGRRVNRKRAAGVIRERDIRCVTRRKCHSLTRPDKRAKPSPGLINRDPTAGQSRPQPGRDNGLFQLPLNLCDLPGARVGTALLGEAAPLAFGGFSVRVAGFSTSSVRNARAAPWPRAPALAGASVLIVTAARACGGPRHPCARRRLRPRRPPRKSPFHRMKRPEVKERVEQWRPGGFGGAYGVSPSCPTAHAGNGCLCLVRVGERVVAVRDHSLPTSLRHFRQLRGVTPT